MTNLIARLAAFNVVGVYAVFVMLFFVPVPSANRELISMLLGNLVGFAAAVMTFFFGSTAESSTKNDTIGAQAEAIKQTAATAAAVLHPTNGETIPNQDGTTVITSGNVNVERPGDDDALPRG